MQLSPVKLSLDVSAVPAQPAGAGRYVLELARGLAARAEQSTVALARRDDASRWERLGNHLKVDPVVPRYRPLRLAWEQAVMPRALARLAVDVHHAPHYTMPERARCPVVVTIHDMTMIDHPQWHERSKVLLFRRAIAVAVKRAAQLIAVSNDTAIRLQQHFGELPVTVIPHGVDHTRFHVGSLVGEREALTKAGIPMEYIGFVGTIEPRKNLVQLVKAFDAVAPKHPMLHLVIAGRRGWGLDAFDAALSESPFRERIVVTGYLSESLIPPFLRNARVVAYPSRMEGFGLPALEAVACGAPVVAARGSAVEEMVGNVATLVEAEDTDALVCALESALDADREALRERSVAIASGYSWEAVVAAHVKVYEKAATG